MCANAPRNGDGALVDSQQALKEPPFQSFSHHTKKAPTLFILQQWRRAHRLESTAGLCHGLLLLDPATRARRHQRIAADATIRDPRRVRLDPDRDRLRRLLVAMDAIGVLAETGAVSAVGTLDRLARALWRRAQRFASYVN